MDSGRKRGGQPGHPGTGPELLPIERVDEVVEHHHDACRHCGTLLQGEDRAPAAPTGVPLLLHQHLRNAAG